jgi:importin-beta-like protein
MVHSGFQAATPGRRHRLKRQCLQMDRALGPSLAAAELPFSISPATTRKKSKYFRPATSNSALQKFRTISPTSTRVTMSSNIGEIAQLLDATLDPSKHRKGTDRGSNNTDKKQTSVLTRPTAESALKQESTKPGYSLNLLNIVASEPLPATTRLSASLAFKNFIRTNYVVRRELLEHGHIDWEANMRQDEEGNYKLPLQEVSTIKQQLVGLMITSPSPIRTQLGEAISLIADSDFWRRWDTLVTVSSLL